MDEKSQSQALDRTQPSLPMNPGRGGTMTHDREVPKGLTVRLVLDNYAARNYSNVPTRSSRRSAAGE
jgi:hypothetical protein